MRGLSPDIAVHLGDVYYNGESKEFQSALYQ